MRQEVPDPAGSGRGLENLQREALRVRQAEGVSCSRCCRGDGCSYSAL